MSEVSPRKCPWLKILLGGVALGVLVLAGLAWGMRVTDARPFCSSCHIMEQAARTHKLSPHAKLACNECHAPTALLSKLPFKAKEGARDFYMNTLGDVDLPIVAGMATKESMVTAPVVVALWDWLFGSRPDGQPSRVRWGLIGGLSATWVL